MAGSTVYTCTQDNWTKVSTAACTLYILESGLPYYFTTRENGGSAPTDLSDSIALLNGEKVQSGVDVYVYALGGTGKVRADT